MFCIGDKVFYGMNGICEVKDISTVDIPGVDKDRLYYILKQKNVRGTMFVAVDCDNSRLRKIMTYEEAVKFVTDIPDIEPLELKDERRPEPEYKQILKKYDEFELVKLIKCIHFRIKKRLDEGKRPTSVDEQYMHLAEEILYQELGEALGISKEQVSDYLMKEIEGI